MAFYLIENTEQLSTFYYQEFKRAFVEVIPFNDLVHPTLNKVSLVYIKPLTDDNEKGYMICIDHSEALNVQIKHVNQVLKSFDEIYVRDKKTFLYYFQLKSSLDITHTTPTYIHPTTQVHTHFYNTYSSRLDINRIIPLVKHYQRCEAIFEQVKNHCVTLIRKTNDVLAYSFLFIEKNGIKINETLFKQYFKPINESFSIKDGKIYTQYNLHTTTGRPSNSFNGVNFAALNKDNGCRQAFIPEHDRFMEIDISAYHPNIVAQLVDYRFDKPIYEAFAEYAGVEVKQAKELMFKQLYGGIYTEYKQWEFFIKVQEYIDKIWEHFETLNWVMVPGSGKYFYKDRLGEMNPQKLFNYFLQNLETVNNSRIIQDIIKVLKGKNTKLVLYTYDAFLFDLDDTEKDIIDELKEIFSSRELQIKYKYGTDYDFE
jgi:hypothetical protein